MNPVKITETCLRDAHQSLFATRMTTDEIMQIMDKIDGIGYHSIECWGGATFDSCLRFLNEDPWERLRLIKSKAKNTKLQMLLRGQNILGYKHYADDVVENFVQKSVENGIDIIRIFDALNDVRNLESSIKATIKAKGEVQAALCYTISPVHTEKTFVKLAKQLEDMGANSICIKDMSGLLDPYGTYNLVKAIKESIKIPLQIHTHATSGLGSMSYLKAIEAGVDIIDTAISPLSMGTSQPPTEAFVATLKDTQRDTGLNLNKLNEVAQYFRPIRQKYIDNGLYSTKVMGVDINTLIYQVPGGMLSNLVSQLEAANAVDKFDEVLKEVPKVREDLGFPPLVTPTSQMVGTQAVFNVISGQRYKMVPKEIKEYVKGMYGKPTIEIKQDIIDKIAKDEKIITSRPADLIEPELDKYKKEMAYYLEQDEDILSYALFPQVAETFFKNRQAKLYKIDSENMIKEGDNISIPTT